jgi:predicted dinucleotide-binding enzyme
VEIMNIGILGAGMIGGALGVLWAKAGHRVMFSSRHPEKLDPLVKSIDGDASSGGFMDAAAHGEVILLAIPLFGIIETFPLIREHGVGKIVIDAMNFFEERDAEVAADIRRFKGAHSAFTASKLPGVRLVKAFNTIYFKTLETETGRDGLRLAIPVASDVDEAKTVVENLVRDAGFEPCDVGTLEDSAIMQPGGLLWTRELTLSEMEALIASR